MGGGDALRKLMRNLPLMFAVSVKTTLDLQSHSLVVDIHTLSILSMVDKYCGCVVNLCVDEGILEFISPLYECLYILNKMPVSPSPSYLFSVNDA